MHIEKKTLRNIFVGVVVCIVLYWVLHDMDRVSGIWGSIKNVLSPFVLGACLAFILNVPMRAIERWLKGIKKDGLRRVVAIVLTFLAVCLVITLVFLLLIPQITETVQSLIPKLSAFVVNTEKNIRKFLEENPAVMEWLSKNTEFEKLDWAGLAQKAVSMIGNSVSAILGTTVSAIGSITSGLFDAFIVFVFAIYCLFQKETLARQSRKLLYAFLPEKVVDETIRILRLANSTFSNFLSGQCIEVCILGALFAVSMSICRMPYVSLVSVLVAVTAFIPVVGAWVGCVVGAFLILVANPIQAVWFVVLFVVLQQIENNLIYPRVVGTSIGLSGMWVLLAVAVGGELFGVIGMFLMIPMASVLQSVLREIVAFYLSKKNIDPSKLEPQPPELRQRVAPKKKAKKAEKPAEEKKD